MTPPARRLRGEDGQVVPILLLLAPVLLVLAGLVFDGGQILTARRDANNLARQAARAGAQELDVNSVRAGTPVLDPAAAEARTRQYLADRGVTPDSVVVTAERVEVTVSTNQPTPLLSLVGISHRRVTATASARSARGVTTEGA
jgi:Flp pilus assembly protein TadG